MGLGEDVALGEEVPLVGLASPWRHVAALDPANGRGNLAMLRDQTPPTS